MSDSHSKGAIALFMFGLFFLVFLGHSCAYGCSSEWTTPVKVTKMERVITGSGKSVSGRYMVWTDREVFENTDTLIYGKWNSADYYGQIEEGKTYRFRVAGWRFGFLSWNRNIIDYEEIQGR